MTSERDGTTATLGLSRRVLARLSAGVVEITPTLIAERRDFHRYAESGWTEFRTISLIARRLVDLGFDVKVGRDVLDPDARMGVPDADVLEAAWARAKGQGGGPPPRPLPHGVHGL